MARTKTIISKKLRRSAYLTVGQYINRAVKVNKGESYIVFSHRIEKVQSSILLKTNETVNDEGIEYLH